MTLKMSILSVDLSLYLNKKRELYALFHGQEFRLPNSTTKEPPISNCIIVLEEFDNAIEKILDIENIFKYKDILKRNYLDLKNKEIKEKAVMFEQKSDDDDEVLNIDTSNQSQTIPETYEDFTAKMLMEDGFDTVNNKVLDKARMEVLGKRSHDNELSSINAELNNIITSMDNDNKSNILRLSDMLELFQGPVPIKDRIIIATTNHFEKIKKSMPALFRAGRMTNVHFDYLDWESLNQLTEYYFSEKMTVEPFTITVPTSEVIELAVKYVLSKKPFKEFETELKQIC